MGKLRQRLLEIRWSVVGTVFESCDEAWSETLADDGFKG